jgi:hypothetical protein
MTTDIQKTLWGFHSAFPCEENRLKNCGGKIDPIDSIIS